MSSSVLSSNNCCGPVTGLLGNQTFLLHAQPQPKTISSPIWRTFYAPPSTVAITAPAPAPADDDDESCLNSIDEHSVSPRLTPSPNSVTERSQSQQLLHRSNTKNNNIQKLSTSNFLDQRMTLQKLPNTILENTAQGAKNAIQKPSIMSVSKLVRPTPKNQHTHHHHNHHNHNHNHHIHQHQQHHQHATMQQHQLNSPYNIDVQSGPMNLVTNTQSLDSQRSRPSSTSSVDIESDDIPESHHHHHHHHNNQQHQTSIGGVVVSNSNQIPTIPNAATYQLSYNHLYANKPGYHNNPVAAAAAAAAAADTLRLHATHYSYAIAAVAAAATATSTVSSTNNNNNNNIFPMNAISPPSLSHHQSPNAPTAAHLPALPPPLPLNSTISTTSLSNNISPRLTDQHQNQHLQQEQNKQQQLQQSININENMNMFSSPTGLSNGTYLNCKSSPASDAESSTENYFKIPNTSGKEGSLKHRILTRPNSTADKEETSTKNAVISTYNSTANFKKGSYIELANGVLRRVEDMRTEDFIQCAERSLHLQLAESTVVKIDFTKPHMVIITFSYDRNRSKADIEVSVEHPFFVYGQGWASCDPDKSHNAFGLKCQRLQVGDICISLTQRTIPAHQSTITTTTTTALVKSEVKNKEVGCTDAVRYGKPELPTSYEGLSSVSMNIKNELQTIMPPPLSAQIQYPHQNSNVNSAVIHRVPPAPPIHFIPCHLSATSLPPHHQLSYTDFPDLVAAAAAYNSGAHLHHLPPPPPSPEAINGFYHQQTQQLFLQSKVTATDLRLQPPQPAPPPPPPPPSLSSSSSSSPSLSSSPSTAALTYCPSRTVLLPPPPPPQSPILEHTQDQPFDASTPASRKRRWSAPEGDCDDNVDDRQDHCQNAKLYKTATKPVTTRVSDNIQKVVML